MKRVSSTLCASAWMHKRRYLVRRIPRRHVYISHRIWYATYSPSPAYYWCYIDETFPGRAITIKLQILIRSIRFLTSDLERNLWPYPHFWCLIYAHRNLRAGPAPETPIWRCRDRSLIAEGKHVDGMLVFNKATQAATGHLIFMVNLPRYPFR